MEIKSKLPQMVVNKEPKVKEKRRENVLIPQNTAGLVGHGTILVLTADLKKMVTKTMLPLLTK